MADKIQLIVTLRKEVADIQTAKTLYQAVKTKMADQPDVIITGSISTHMDQPGT